MWLVILIWITLFQLVRQFFGLMLLMGIIFSGKKGFEFKFLDFYFFILVDELLSFIEFFVYDFYRLVSMNIKVVLFQYLCDILVYFKVMYLLGYGGFRFCFYCREVGYYCKYLCKIIYMLNR